MNNKEKFFKYLNEESSITNINTIKKYVGAINTISKDLNKYNKTNINIYEIYDLALIDKIKSEYLKIDDLKDKDIRGHGMYTCALNWYNKYISSYKNNTNNKFISRLNLNKNNLIYKKKSKDNPVIIDGKKQWKRDKSIVDGVMQHKNYKCEYNNEHNYFISNKTKKNYVECHHLIPMKYQDNFDYSLDVEGNLISLCPICHRILHNGLIEDKKNIIKKIYELNKDNLIKCGLEINLEDLTKLYE